MIGKILIAFAMALVVVGMVVVLQPPNYHVERTIKIAAQPAVIFALVNDPAHWDTWSPWGKNSPGTMTVTRSEPDTHVTIHVESGRPCEMGFLLRPEQSVTAVTWTVDGENNFALKALSVFSGMDRMVGPDLEKGLTQLKAVAEGARQ